MFDYQILLFYAGSIVLRLAYTWFYEESISGTREQAGTSLFTLSRKGERLRWRLAAVSMYTILLVVLVCKVNSWGIYAGIAIGVAGYFTGDVATTKFGGYALTPRQPPRGGGGR